MSSSTHPVASPLATEIPAQNYDLATPAGKLHRLCQNRWLEDGRDEARQPWLHALGVMLHLMRWNGTATQLSDVLPRANLLDGTDDLLNALAALGFIASRLPAGDPSLWLAEEPPFIAVVDNAEETSAEACLQPVVVAGMGAQGRWKRATLDEQGQLALHEEPFQPERVMEIYSLCRTDALHDSSEEFARTQTGTSWMRSTLWRFRRLFRQMLAVSMVIGALTVAVPLFVMMVYDLVIDSHSLATMSNATTLLMYLVLGVGLAMLAEAALRVVLIRSLAWFGARMQVLVGTALIGQFLALPPALTERASVADQLARIRAFDTMRDFISGPQMLSTLELPWCLVLLLVVGVLGGEMVLVPLLGIGLFCVLAVAIRKPLEYEMYAAARSGSERQQTAMDMLTRLPAMKYAGVADSLFTRYATAVRKTMRTRFRINQMVAVLEHSAHALTALVGLLTLVVGLSAIWQGQISVGELVAIMILTWRLLGIVQANCVLQPRIHYLRTSSEQINRLMSLKPEDADYQHEVGEQGLEGQLDCNGVVLRYSRTGDYILRGVTLSVRPGQLVAVMGQSGAGKSSLLKLLAGLYPPQAGSLRVDGTNIRQYLPHNLRQHMAYMPQTPDFFSGTIADNLRLLAPDASDAELREAIGQAGAADEIAAMPEGVATRIGIGQAPLPPSLSHRLNLARVYLQAQKRVMLLDELPFDVLNSASGEQLYEFLKASRGMRSVVYVTHRMDFAELADQLVWLRQDMPPLIGAPKQVIAAMQQELQP
jgi:ATP-binding cassette, subfamily C, bacterial LapB